MTPIAFDGQVALVTGAARGLGLAYAQGLAARGARVLLADLGEETQQGAEAIRAAGGQALACRLDVTDVAAVRDLVGRTLADWGRLDVLINNAGILRDRSFGKLEPDDVRAVLEVHLMGTVHCCKAAWPAMRAQGYGRILLTSSSSGLYGIFGQANYAAAKAAMVGLMNVLHLEGERHGIRVNAILPAAATRMTEGLLGAEAARLLTPEAVAPGALFLVSPDAPSRVLLAAGAGTFARVYISETPGVSLAGDALTPEGVAQHFAAISDPAGAVCLSAGFEQPDKLVAAALRAAANRESPA